MDNRKQFSESLKLFERAAQVIPGGIYGHHSPTTVLPLASPYYAQRAEGAHYYDVDGNEFIDMMCGYGPIVMGHQHPEVEEAAERQRRLGDCFNQPAPVMVELAEWLTGQVRGMHWSVFGKNGSDMTSWAVQVAREFTGRKKVLIAKGAYHGTHAWCTPGHGGLIEEDRAAVLYFNWNDTEGFAEIMEAHGEEIAAVMLTPYHHPVFADQEWGESEFMRTVQKCCKDVEALLILDDIRAGFRLSVSGSHTVVGLEPDLICYCKAMGNGYPISACMGTDAVKLAASRVFLTGSYWNGAVAMAAALETLKLIKRENVVGHVERLGRRLQSGLSALGHEVGLPVRVSGPPALPFMRFEDDPGFHHQQRFCGECMKRGVYLHPHHNWFLCAAHSYQDIENVLYVAADALRMVRASV